MPPKNQNRKNPAVRKANTSESSQTLVSHSNANPANTAALKAATSYAKNHLGLAFDKRSYYSLLSDSMRAYLSVLVNPFELARMQRSAGIPVAPSVPSRKYSCFARGTFSTVPRDTSAPEWDNLSAAQKAQLLDLTEENVGWIMVSPKLFGVNTTNPVYTRTKYEGRDIWQNDNNLSESDLPTTTTTIYRIHQQPVVYTTANNKYGAPSRLFEANPYLQGERLPIVAVTGGGTSVLGTPLAVFSPGLDVFQTPVTPVVGTSTDTYADLSGVSMLGTNLSRCSSNSDVMWQDVMPPDPYVGTTSGNLAPSAPFVFNAGAGDTSALTCYSGSSVLNTRKYRLVSCGIRIKFIGAEINRGGQVIGIREPSGLTMASGAYGGISVTSPLTNKNLVGNLDLSVTAPFVTTDGDSPALLVMPAGYEVKPGFRSADWRAFGAIPAAPFGCTTGNVVVGSIDPVPNQWAGAGNAVATPYDTRVNPNDTYGFDQLSEYDEGVPGDVERPWDELVYYPIDPSNSKYEYLYETCSETRGGRMGLSTPTVIYGGPTSVDAKETPPPQTPRSRPKLGHFVLNGKPMSASDATRELSKQLTKIYKEHMASHPKMASHASLVNEKLKDGLQAVTALVASPGPFNANTSGDIGVHLGVSLADNDWGYTLAWMVRGPDSTTETKFQFEVVGHYEIIGREVRGQTAGAAPDPVGIAAMSSLSHDLAYATTSTNRVKLNAPAVGSQVVQAIQAQSGSVDRDNTSVHKKIMDTATTAADHVKSAVSTAKKLKGVYDDVQEFLAPALEALAALF